MKLLERNMETKEGTVSVLLCIAVDSLINLYPSHLLQGCTLRAIDTVKEQNTFILIKAISLHSSMSPTRYSPSLHSGFQQRTCPGIS